MDYYRKTREVSLDEIAQADQTRALTTGLAIRANRVAKLQALADLLERDITGDSLWVTDVKQAGGEMVYITRFNASEVEQYREALDDIAREMGDRRANVQHSGDPTNPVEVEVVHFYIPENGRPHPGQKGRKP